MKTENAVETGRLLRRMWSNNTAENRESVVNVISTIDMGQAERVLAVAVMCDGMDMGERADFVAALKARLEREP